jgi:Flp pilus assembly pilin Flp
MKKIVLRFVYDDLGQDLVEYALLAAFIAVAVAAAVGSLGEKIAVVYNGIVEAF